MNRLCFFYYWLKEQLPDYDLLFLITANDTFIPIFSFIHLLLNLFTNYFLLSKVFFLFDFKFVELILYMTH